MIERARAEGERAHRILLSASAIVQPFDPETLAALLEEDAFDLLGELERLSERNLLKVDGNGSSFRVELVREVLSHSMSPARRRLQQHRADGFEGLASVAVSERVAGSLKDQITEREYPREQGTQGTDRGSETLTVVA